MSVYATGRDTGLAVDVGEDITRTTPVFAGFSVPWAQNNMEIGGRVLMNWLQKLFQDTSDCKNFNSTAELEIVRDIKEKLGYVAQNYEIEHF